MSAPKIDIDHWRQWIGCTETSEDVVTAETIRRFRSLLDQEPGHPATGEPAPLAIHWCLSPNIAPMSQLGPDGHPERGGFLPPVPLPRRMWAGCESRFSDDLRVGDTVVKRSLIQDITMKEGRSGALCFVKVEHTYETQRGVALSEVHDIVYRDIAPAGAAQTAPPPASAPVAETSRSIAASETLLFRYSAVTFNTHRIHYDHPYATGVEGYPGLVVHGPLQATFLLHAAAEAGGSAPKIFTHRGVSPLYAGGHFTVGTRRTSADEIACWTLGADGRTAMTATARW